MKLKCWLPSVIFLSFTVLNCYQRTLNIAGLWPPGPRKKIYDFLKLKTFKRSVNSHEFLSGTKKLLRLLSHDPWAWKQKIVFHGNWNPRVYHTPGSLRTRNLMFYTTGQLKMNDMLSWTKMLWFLYPISNFTAWKPYHAYSTRITTLTTRLVQVY